MRTFFLSLLGLFLLVRAAQSVEPLRKDAEKPISTEQKKEKRQEPHCDPKAETHVPESFN